MLNTSIGKASVGEKKLEKTQEKRNETKHQKKRTWKDTEQETIGIFDSNEMKRKVYKLFQATFFQVDFDRSNSTKERFYLMMSATSTNKWCLLNTGEKIFLFGS